MYVANAMTLNDCPTLNFFCANQPNSKKEPHNLKSFSLFLSFPPFMGLPKVQLRI